MSHLSMWTVTTMVLVCENEVRLTSWEVKVIGVWDHLVWVIVASTAT
jgi:hypothetical protein